ncbi:hypothetical protein Tco_0891262 [Tanacetum coccineum]|uniref:Integrase, catalytic region, zinc finger, CCHC-type, peptidase aspartic, catalytic n=1 Tax=Tanacetum coccineum TaxID=301880 RepID=A0ABQ5C2E8_9ASTR
MSSMSEDIQCAGSDTRPPMLDRTDFESWQQRIRLYCLGKDNGENIMKSITEGPFQMGTMRDTLTEGGEGALHLGPERARVFADLSAEQKDRYKADIRATNILLQGIPKDIYTLINHFTDAKDIWDNVKMILEGSELTKDDRESQLYDEFEHFCQIKGETIHVYYVRFTKLINDMRNIKMTMPRMQLNSKFVNNMLPEWSRFITEVKLNRGLKESNFDQLYAYLKQHEVHANENRTMMERFLQPTNDPLALVSNASVQQYSTQSSKSPQSSNEPSPADNFQLDSGSSSTENLIESLSNSLALLTQSYKSHLPQTNNQLRTSSNARNKATVQDGRVVVQDGASFTQRTISSIPIGGSISLEGFLLPVLLLVVIIVTGTVATRIVPRRKDYRIRLLQGQDATSAKPRRMVAVIDGRTVSDQSWMLSDSDVMRLLNVHYHESHCVNLFHFEDQITNEAGPVTVIDVTPFDGFKIMIPL